MAHPSSTLPKNVYILSSTNILKSGQGLPRGSRVFALTNPTDTEISAGCIGSNKIWNSQNTAYETTTVEQTIAVQPGATIYGSWSSVKGAGLLAYVG